MSKITIDNKDAYKHALNKRNAFQILRSEEIKARNNITIQQGRKVEINKIEGIKPNPVNLVKLGDGRFFN